MFALNRGERRLYGFGPFVLDADERLLTLDGSLVQLPPKAFDLLIVLIKNGGHLVRKEEILRTIWPDAEVEEGNITFNISLVRKALSDNATKPSYIETVPKQGYRFIAPVRLLKEEEARPLTTEFQSAEETNASEVDEQEPANKESEVYADRSTHLPPLSHDSLSLSRRHSVFNRYFSHAVLSCSLYGLLYSIAFVLEVSYQFDRFGAEALRIAPLVFLWIWSTSMVGLGISWKLAGRRKEIGLVLCLLVFIGASMLLYALSGLFLPDFPVTEANFQTYPAHGAFLKSVYYFLPLAILFLVMPFHFVITMHEELLAGRYRTGLGLLTGRRSFVIPVGTVYLRVSWLGLLLFCAVVMALIATAHLFENLKPGGHMNLFMQLAQWRLLLYFLLGAECLIWYYASLNEIKHECLESVYS